MTIRRGKKLGYALPLSTDYRSVEKFKKHEVTKCPLHANQECILKRISELKSSKKSFSMKSDTDDGLSCCSNFPERPTETELASNKPVLPEIENLKGKCHEIEIEEGSVPHREGARIITTHKSEACREEIEMVIEYDMIE